MNDANQMTPAPPDLFAMFVGSIDQAAVERYARNMAFLTNPNAGTIHLMFQSNGGIVGDGVCLYNLFRFFPGQLTIYNTGAVCSIATIAYLGAPRRKVSAHATFMLHRSTLSPQFASARRLEVAAQVAAIEDARTEAIVRSALTLSAEQWALLQHHDLNLTAQQAVEAGLADEIAEFAPPAGTQVFAIL